MTANAPGQYARKSKHLIAEQQPHLKVQTPESTNTGGRRSASGHTKVREKSEQVCTSNRLEIPNDNVWYLVPAVVDHFDLSREIVSIAVNHMDRYLSASPSAIEKSSFQLLSLTCLYLAIKLNEVRIIKIPGSKSTMDTLHQLSRGFFSLKDMEEMERDILQRLQWHVHPPTPQQFLKTILFLTVNEEDDFAKELYGLANFQVELAVLDYYFASYKLSEIAMASFLNALDELDPTNKTSCRWTLSHILDGFYVDKANVAACRRRLALIYSENNTASAAMHSTSIRGAGDGRTASPVCVMDPPMA